MNEEPKSIWKKSWKLPGSFLGGLVLATGLAFVISLLGVIIVDQWRWRADWGIVLAGTMGGTMVALLVLFIRWLFHWRNFKRFLFGFACFITLIALFYAEEDWRGWHAWNKFKQAWEAKGEHFGFASLVPPPVPDDQNFALTPIWVESIKATLGPKRARLWYGDKFPDNGRTNFTDRLALDVVRNGDWGNAPANGNWAKGTFTDLKLWQAYYRAPAQTNRNSPIATNEFPIASQPQSPAEDVLLALSKSDPAIEELREASQLAYSRFPLEYDTDNLAAILLPHLAKLKRCSQVLQLRAIAELQKGQTEKALADAKLALQLTGKIRTEPCLISHLVRIGMLQIMLRPVWEGLAQHKWSDEQLVALDAELAKLDFLPDYKLAMHSELGFQGSEMDLLRRHPEQMRGLSGMNAGVEGGMNLLLPDKFAARLIPAGWFYQNQLRCARMMMEYYIPLADVNQDTFSPDLARRGDAALTAETKSASPFNMLEKLMLPALGNAAKKFAYAQTSVDLARTAIALERYRLAHGEHPKSLDVLVPQFIGKIPHDVINGQPLHYRLDVNGQFALYSVGWNETDDGGENGFKKDGSMDISTGDWVWRYPAK
jgi:hypothetical protein